MNIQAGGHIHLMGICGTAMASLAGLLKERGFKITGSDQNVYPPMSTLLEDLGIPIMEGYKKENLDPKPDLVIVGNVITRKHEEAQALLVSDIPYTSLPKAIGEFLIQDRHSVVVAGTHGKTTTTSMTAWMAEACGKKPGFLIGGIAKNFGISFRNPEADLFVIEGDEYDTAFFDKVPKFIHYKPQSVILSSIEFDHADIYDNLEQVKDAFVRLLDLIPEDGLLIYRAEDKNIDEILNQKDYRFKKVSYGWEEGDYQVRNFKADSKGMHFDIYLNNEKVDHLDLDLLGKYNATNALSAFALARERAWGESEAKKGLESFKGVKRRQEILGHPGGVCVIEDFAHHPTAVGMTIDAVQERFADKNVYAIFEPRSATSRRSVFQKDYFNALKNANTVLIAKPYDQSKIKEDDRFSSHKLVEDLKADGVDAMETESNQEIVDIVKQRATLGDAVLIMSNGGFGGLYNQLIKALNK